MTVHRDEGEYNKVKQIPNPTTVVKDNPKTTGVKTRGNGAATKGTKARGPMG